MKSLKDIPALKNLAARILWFEPPSQSLADETRFLVYAMTAATSHELALLRRHVSDKRLRAALKAAPPGIMDRRSWAYWHVMLENAPAPPLPRRKLKKQRPALPSRRGPGGAP